MEPTIEKLLEVRYGELPPRIRAYLSRPLLITSLRIIAEKHHLPEDRAKTLENEVMLVLLAFTTMDTFEETLVRELLIPGSVAASIARDVNEMIFAEVRPDLEEIYRQREGYEKSQGGGSAQGGATPAPVAPRPASTFIRPAAPSEPPVIQPPRPPLTDVPKYSSDPYREQA